MEWGRGPAVLCAHGWSSRALRFRALIERLVKSGFRVVALDAPGHGQSSGRHTDVIEYAEAIRVVADNAGDLHGAVGHSFGAMALLLALEKGLKVRKVVFFRPSTG
ncbi:MAG: alpha/beta fold hydrolase [Terriglobia bacterium]